MLWQLWTNFLRNWLRSIFSAFIRTAGKGSSKSYFVNVERIRVTNTDRGREKLSDVSIMECIVYWKPKFREFLSAIYVELIVKSARVYRMSLVLRFGIWSSLFREKFYQLSDQEGSVFCLFQRYCYLSQQWTVLTKKKCVTNIVLSRLEWVALEVRSKHCLKRWQL